MPDKEVERLIALIDQACAAPAWHARRLSCGQIRLLKRLAEKARCPGNL